MLESKEIGLQLLQSNHVSLLKIGTTLANLHIFGNTPVLNDLFIRVDKDIEIVSWISFKIFMGMLFGPELLLLFKLFIKSDISLGVLGEI